MKPQVTFLPGSIEHSDLANGIKAEFTMEKAS